MVTDYFQWLKTRYFCELWTWSRLTFSLILMVPWNNRFEIYLVRHFVDEFTISFEHCICIEFETIICSDTISEKRTHLKWHKKIWTEQYKGDTIKLLTHCHIEKSMVWPHDAGFSPWSLEPQNLKTQQYQVKLKLREKVPASLTV